MQNGQEHEDHNIGRTITFQNLAKIKNSDCTKYSHAVNCVILSFDASTKNLHDWPTGRVTTLTPSITPPPPPLGLNKIPLRLCGRQY